MQVFRKLECTQCSHVHCETGEPIKERIGDVVMRRCVECDAPTVHIIVAMNRLKQVKAETE